MSADCRQCMLLGALIVAAAVAVFVAVASAQGLSLSVFGLSHHSERGRYCETNPGLGINYNLTRDTRLLAGFYKNSLCRESKVAGVVWCGMRYGNACAGVGFACLTGYSTKPVCVPLPTASYEQRRYAVDWVGGTDGRLWVVGVGLRFPI